MKEIVVSDRAPAAIGPYSQAIKSGGLLFVSGQIPLDPAKGTMVEGGIATQTRQVLKNVKEIVEAAGFTLQNVVKCSCFLKNMEDFTDFNEVYAEYFSETPPARECMEAARLPKDASVEISAICAK